MYSRTNCKPGSFPERLGTIQGTFENLCLHELAENCLE